MKGRRGGYFPLAVTYCDPICSTETVAAVQHLKTRGFNHVGSEVNTELDSKVLVVVKKKNQKFLASVK